MHPPPPPRSKLGRPLSENQDPTSSSCFDDLKASALKEADCGDCKNSSNAAAPCPLQDEAPAMVSTVVERRKPHPCAKLTIANSSPPELGGISRNDSEGGRKYDTRRSIQVSILQHISPGVGEVRDGSEGDDNSCGSDGGVLVKLPLDVFSLVFYSSPVSIPFFFSVMIFSLQVVILLLIMVDLVKMNDDVTFPAGVSSVVRASQFLAILIAVATQDDIITAVNALHHGYSDIPAKYRQENDCGKKGGGGARWQWTLAVTLRGAMGFLCLAVTFMLIMKSDTVTDIFVDFLAVTFVSTIDNISFMLAREGFFGSLVRKEVKAVSRVQVPGRPKGRNWFRPLVAALIAAGMLTGWGIIGNQQKSGSFLSCRSIYVQYGDEFYSRLGFFSGVYRFSDTDEFGRPIYMAAEGIGVKHGVRIAYCNELKAWTLSFASNEGGIVDVCDWQARTAPNDKYDVLDIPPSEWLVPYLDSSGAKRGVPPRYFAISCDGCDDSDSGSCQSEGVCVNNRCVCHEGWFGRNCQFSSPCSAIELDLTATGLWGSEKWAGVYHILFQHDGKTMVVFNERPIYTREFIPGDHHVIFFTGRRWFISSTSSLIMNTPERPVTQEELSDFVVNTIETNWTSLLPVLISSPVDVQTPSDRPDPAYLEWFHPEAYNTAMAQKHLFANLSPTATHVRCIICNDATNPCWNKGVCTSSGACSCYSDTFGALCQVTSSGLCYTIDTSIKKYWLDKEQMVSILSDFGVGETFSLNYSRRIGYRPMYRGRKGSGFFAFCSRKSFWALIGSDDHDPCLDWVAKSPMRGSSYDVLADDKWFVKSPMPDDAGRSVFIESPFELTCKHRVKDSFYMS